MNPTSSKSSCKTELFWQKKKKKKRKRKRKKEERKKERKKKGRMHIWTLVVIFVFCRFLFVKCVNVVPQLKIATQRCLGLFCLYKILHICDT